MLRSTRLRTLCISLAFLFSAACADDTGSSDKWEVGEGDGYRADSGSTDPGDGDGPSSPVDAGPTVTDPGRPSDDAGPTVTDAGQPSDDAGQPSDDAGSGPLIDERACRTPDEAEDARDQCDMLEQDCPEGATCRMLLTFQDGSPRLYANCTASDDHETAQEGEDCGGGEECAPTLHCTSSPGTCSRVCDTVTGEGCVEGEFCQPFSLESRWGRCDKNC